MRRDDTGATLLPTFHPAGGCPKRYAVHRIPGGAGTVLLGVAVRKVGYPKPLEGNTERHSCPCAVGARPDRERGAVETGDLIDDRQPQAAAVSGRVRASDRTAASRARARSPGCRGPYPPPARKGLPLVFPALTVTAPPRGRVLEGVVDQIAEQVVQERRVGHDRNGLHLGTEIDFRLQRAIEEFGDDLARRSS